MRQARVILYTCFAVFLVPLAVHAKSWLYLNFSDGTEAIYEADRDAAESNRSQLCSTEKLALWDGASDCGDRESCKEEIRSRVQDHLRGVDVEVVLERPAAPYAMVVVAPGSGGCAFGLQGVAFTDCDNSNPSNVGFAFECSVSAGLCAAVVAHEFGHSVGLSHVTDPTDIMSVGMDGQTEVAFQDQELETAEGSSCNRVSQNSYQTLRKILGPRDDEYGANAAMAGCSIPRGPGRQGGGLLAVVVSLISLTLAASPRAPSGGPSAIGRKVAAWRRSRSARI